MNYIIALTQPATDGPYLGEVRTFAFGFAPQEWTPCEGALVPIFQNVLLFRVLGTTYGGNGETDFGLPDLRGTGAEGNTAAHVAAPAPGPRLGFLVMNFCIAMSGVFPARG
jgi:microcystin-dependent protein